MSRDEILAAAERIVARSGLRQLSMPGLARELSCGVTSIYWYFRNKDELLAAMAADSLRRGQARLRPVGEGPWQQELVEYFAGYRDLLNSSDVYREIGTYRPDLLTGLGLPGVRSRHDEGTALLRRAGFSETSSMAAFMLCANYTRGFVALEQGVEAARRQRGDAADDDRSDHAPATDRYGTDDEQLDADHYRLGLRTLVSGIAADLLGGDGPD